jgi:hypothetical protein
MRIVHRSLTELVVRDSSLWMSGVCAGGALLLAGYGIAEREINFFWIAAFFLLCGTILARTTTFTFDGMQRVVRWHGYKPFKKASGTIPFDSIADITIEISLTGSGAPTYCLCLGTTAGPVPMAYLYTASRDAYVSLRQELLRFLRPGLVELPPDLHAPSDGVPAALESSFRVLLARGRKVDAIALLRATEHIGLAEAAGRIQAIDAKRKTERNAPTS